MAREFQINPFFFKSLTTIGAGNTFPATGAILTLNPEFHEIRINVFNAGLL